MKTVDTKEYISMLRTLIEEGKQVSMIISGSSMAPFLIHARDHICLKSPSGELRKGDMVFYQRSNGEYVMHRIYNVKNEEYYLWSGVAETQASLCAIHPDRRLRLPDAYLTGQRLQQCHSPVSSIGLHLRPHL